MKLTKNRLVGLSFLLLGIILIWFSSQIYYKRTLATMGDVGPRCFPYIASIGLAICGLGIIVTDQGDQGTKFPEKAILLKELSLLCLFIAYVFALKYIGFLISTPITLFILIRLLRNGAKTNLAIDLLVSIAFPGLVYLIFVNVLRIMIPRGIIF